MVGLCLCIQILDDDFWSKHVARDKRVASRAQLPAAGRTHAGGLQNDETTLSQRSQNRVWPRTYKAVAVRTNFLVWDVVRASRTRKSDTSDDTSDDASDFLVRDCGGRLLAGRQ